ncbi:hypothetical protein JRO89_XS14G0163100 [Xanthoceras sorbifolium]|uniref:RNase H type-1 domain-containing protein n=1 Tax=Xanthoceras sorbifolium TaxID=99658 RepID=A0ABQ8H5F3_9ROSI|nr:hypothetical protein JRO89_XS14G0163100 [Xanthoceras sorbifolium]
MPPGACQNSGREAGGASASGSRGLHGNVRSVSPSVGGAVTPIGDSPASGPKPSNTKPPGEAGAAMQSVVAGVDTIRSSALQVEGAATQSEVTGLDANRMSVLQVVGAVRHCDCGGGEKSLVLCDVEVVNEVGKGSAVEDKGSVSVPCSLVVGAAELGAGNGCFVEAVVHGNSMQRVGNVEEGAAASFVFAAQCDVLKTGVSSSPAADMEVDRRHFKWKRVARRRMIGDGVRRSLPCLGKQVELESQEGAGCGEEGASSSSAAASSWWKFLWGLNITAKCGAAVESVLHSLWLCRSLVEAKAAFWFHRNRIVHGTPLLSLKETVGWSELYLADFQGAAAVPGVRLGLVVERWRVPSPGWVKINSDVAVNIRGRRLGFGVVFRDSTGKVLVSYTSLLLGLFSPNIGEALAILRGLHLAFDLGFSTVCVESDAASVVKQLSSRAISCSDIGLILDDILDLVVVFSNFSFSSIGRSANKVAHGLAKFALSHQSVGVRLGVVPSSLDGFVLDDSHGCV